MRADGVLIEVLIADKNGRLEKTRRVNPAYKVHFDAVMTLKRLNRQMQFLCEERETAEAAQRKAEEDGEFRI
jgi:hypothetical protein